MKTSNLISRLLCGAAICAISVDGAGNVSGGGGAMRVVGDGDAAPIAMKPAEVDPNAPVPKAEDAQEVAAAEEVKPNEGEAQKEEPAKEETAEEKTTREAKEAEDAAAKPKAELSPEETAEIDGRADLNDVQKDSMKKYTVEMKSTGALSEESIADAAKVWNVPESMVRDYVKSITPGYQALKEAAEKAPEGEKVEAGKPPTPAQEAAHQERLNGLYETAGGQANYDAFAAWAMDGGLTDSEILDITQSADISKAAGQRALASYLPKFNATGGAKGGPKLDVSRSSASERPQPEGIKGFASRDEQNAALNKTNDNGRPLMETDPAYRKSIEERIAVTTFKVPGSKGAMM